MSCAYTYYNNATGAWYGFENGQIDQPLSQNKSPIIICNDMTLLVKLCERYKGRVCPIFIVRYEGDDDFREELEAQGRTEEEIKRRMEKRTVFLDMWKKYKEVFGYRYIVNSKFIDKEYLEFWFGRICKENGVDIGEFPAAPGGIITYFRTLWKGRIQPMGNIGDEPDLSISFNQYAH